ncbi:1487_t:CDS:2, partial [Racocetra fulgida]
MSYLLSKEFGWENYKTYSADIRIRDAYWNLIILQTLLKMDIFFIGSYALQLIPSQRIGYYSNMSENEQSGSSYLGAENVESPSSKRTSKRESAIRQQQLFAQQRENDK